MLTLILNQPILKMHWQNPVLGIGLSEIIGIGRKHAVFLCVKSQFFIIMLDWARQSKDWLGSLIPVDQLRSVRHHDWSHVVGIKTLSTEAVMPKIHTQIPTKQKPTNHVSLKSIFLLLDSDKNLITSSLTFEQVKPLSEHIKGSIIKFQAMVRLEVLA